MKIQRIRRKKALSEMVAYVILITIGLSLSSLVYIWLKNYVVEIPQKTCPEGTTLIIKDYACNKTGNTVLLNLTIKNKGLFPVDGFIIKINDRLDATMGIYSLHNSGSPEKGEEMSPGEEKSYQFSLKDDAYNGENQEAVHSLTLVEVQPMIDKNNSIFCDSVSSQITRC